MVSVVTPLQVTDGVHQLVLALTPSGLGVVQASLTVAGAAVSVHLSVDSPAAHQALADALPHLKQELAAGGQEVTVSLGFGGDRQASQWAPKPGFGGSNLPSESEAATAATASSVAAPGSVSQVDLRL